MKSWELHNLVFSPDALFPRSIFRGGECSHLGDQYHSTERSLFSGECPLHHLTLRLLALCLSPPAAEISHFLSHWWLPKPGRGTCVSVPAALSGTRGEVIPSEIPPGDLNDCANAFVT